MKQIDIEEALEQIGLIRDKALNGLAASKLQLAPQIHVEGLIGFLEDIRDSANQILGEESAEIEAENEERDKGGVAMTITIPIWLLWLVGVPVAIIALLFLVFCVWCGIMFLKTDFTLRR
jgi:hypothetical protein